MPHATDTGLTRRDMLKVGSAAAAAGYCLAAEPILAQAIKTDTQGIQAGDASVKIGTYEMPVYYAQPAGGPPAPVLLVISEIWGVHEYIKDCARRFAKAGYCAVAPELFKREGNVAQMTNVQDILKIVLAVPRKQMLGDAAAAIAFGNTRPNVKADRVGVTGWCWGGSTTMQITAAIPAVKAAVAWYGPPARPYKDEPNPVSGFDVVKDIKVPFLGLFGETDQSPSPADAIKFG